jgi:ssDNA-binding Zn-finger/Zn-ribbon topoisomerase 1
MTQMSDPAVKYFEHVRRITTEQSDRACPECGAMMTKYNIRTSFFYLADYKCEKCHPPAAPGAPYRKG